ncbi:hypothetical protein R1Y80_09770 [Streptomyces sp. JL1001]|uniref:Uncharacterized protein n=2 Tax=Streptomyces TaxID=1883 RepID=A0AAU8KFZ9_9ACTN
MPTDPNHRALLRAVEKLTTQVKRIADTLEPPAVGEADGAQTTGDDAQPLTVRKIASWYPTCPSGRHPHHPSMTCEEQDAFAGRVQAFFERAAVPDMQHVTATMRENEQLRTERDRVRRLAEQWKNTSDRKHGPLRELLQALDGS